MFHIHCTLPNASNLINGVSFKAHDKDGVITASPVETAVAAQFKGIPGYSIIDATPTPKKKGKSAPDAVALNLEEKVDPAPETEDAEAVEGGDSEGAGAS